MFNGIMVTALIAAGLGLLAYNAEQLSETTGSLPGKVGKGPIRKPNYTVESRFRKDHREGRCCHRKYDLEKRTGN